MWTVGEIQNAYALAHDELKIYYWPYPPRNGLSKRYTKPHIPSHTLAETSHTL